MTAAAARPARPPAPLPLPRHRHQTLLLQLPPRRPQLRHQQRLRLRHHQLLQLKTPEAPTKPPRPQALLLSAPMVPGVTAPTAAAPAPTMAAFTGGPATSGLPDQARTDRRWGASSNSSCFHFASCGRSWNTPGDLIDGPDTGHGGGDRLNRPTLTTARAPGDSLTTILTTSKLNSNASARSPRTPGERPLA